MTTPSETVYPQEVWDEEHARDVFAVADPRDQVRRWIDRHTSGLAGPATRALEIGCFPGRYLAYFGERGFEVNGIDLTPRVAPEMGNWLRARGYRVGRIEKGDFFAFRDERGFDLVLSNGFLEHFEDWRVCLEMHLNLVRPGGLLLLATPNFAGRVQNFLHQKLDAENLSRHVLSAMDIAAWSEVARARGFEIVAAEHFAEFDFWNGPQSRPFWQKAAARAIRGARPLLRAFFRDGDPASAPYCGLVARRK